jgi:hypothetical protein
MQEPVALCPRCGARIEPAKGPSWVKMLGAVLLILLALPMGASGACFVVVAGIILNDGARDAFLFGLIGVALLALTWACIKGARNLWK